MSGSRYEAIVVGLGAAGSAATYHLARRGHRVLGLEMFQRAHGLGSSGGLTRIIRMSYFEHPDYVPLLERAWDLWLELERETGESLMRQTGGLYAGAPDSEILAGSIESARRHGLAHEVLDADEMRRRWPIFRFGDEMRGLLEERGGVLAPERSIDAHLAVAERYGAELRFEEQVLGWEPVGGGVRVRTSAGTYEADRLVVAAGAWIPGLLPGVDLRLWVERVPLFWLEPTRPARDMRLEELPVWIMEVPQISGGAVPEPIWAGEIAHGHGLGGETEAFYGFPLDEVGLKVARHHSGVRTDPDTVDREPSARDEAVIRAFTQRYMPAADGPVTRGMVCMYTNTPDLHFVIDRHPQHDAVVFASACSGHGFKFSSVTGEVLADLAIEGRSEHPIEFLSLDRFGRSRELAPAG